VFRTLNPHPEQYTWWSNRGQAWAKNVGWRLDYHLATPGIAAKARREHIYLSSGSPTTRRLRLTGIDYDFSQLDEQPPQSRGRTQRRFQVLDDFLLQHVRRRQVVELSRLSSFSQKMSRLALSRAIRSSCGSTGSARSSFRSCRFSG
jgi:hypothetical protein